MTNPQCPFCQAPLSEHEAGRCLDAMVHQILLPHIKLEHVCKGFPEHKYDTYIDNEGRSNHFPHYSTDLNHAIELLPKGWWLRQSINTTEWMAVQKKDDLFVKASTPALAICRAYIQMKEEEK